MNTILGNPNRGITTQLLAQATQSSNARAAFIAGKEEKEQEKSAVLDYTTEIKTAAQESGTSIEQLQKKEQAKTLFNTQQIAQDNKESTEIKPNLYETAVESFQEYMEQTPEERWFEKFLKEQGLTKEEFDALSPEDQQALLEKFKDYVQHQIEESEAKKQLEEKLDIKT